MTDRVLMALAFVMSVGPAFAFVGDAITVPEPASITIFGTAVVGAFIARKFGRRK